MSEKMDKRHCSGCRDDFYNQDNNSTTGECWMLSKATLVSRIPVGLWEAPPYKGKRKVRVPNCYHESGNQRTIYVDPAALDEQGFWKR